jgi:2-desacetyl-2-hydroxyethyl bacteriochlorophyllide A dehydrogenase
MAAQRNPALVVRRAGEVALADQLMADPGPGQILVRNSFTTMNLGTEMAVFNGAFRPGSWWDRNIRYPHCAGWGCLGHVAAVGAGVTKFEIGDRVVCDGHHGAYYLAGSGSPDGPQRVPAAVSDDQACLWSLSRVAMHGIRVGGLALGESAAVLGLGIVGQLALRFAWASGALPLAAVDVSPARLELARRGGASRVLAMAVEDAGKALLALNRDRKLDCVFDVTGNPDVIPHALRLPRMRGRLVILGSPRGPSTVDFHDEIHFGVDVLGAQWNTYPPVETPQAPWTAARNGQLYFDLVQAGRIDVEGLISHTFNWREAPEVYQEVQADRSGFMGIRFDWRDCC